MNYTHITMKNVFLQTDYEQVCFFKSGLMTFPKGIIVIIFFISC
ncbi:Uncharacterized protein dnm_019120 [Desulfonema magnum]|uniref:Uncharacterized protein n=1 Tax=Desulfonema magnum TaxID=45655 RepID=A0A975BIE2_9BACT|nr:Uncharacterized protein dnm_019120 [Desulfonema magnum]